MDQQLDRADPSPPAAQRPSVERMVGRPAKGEQRLGPQIAGYGADDAARPAVDRVGGAILPFGLRSDMGPKSRLGRAKQQQTLRFGWQAFFFICMKSAQDGQMMMRRQRADVA